MRRVTSIRTRLRRSAVTTGSWTGRGLMLAAGRLVLWLAIGLVLVRGVGIMAAPRSTPAAPVKDQARMAGWPDDAVRAVATEFATAYLTHDPSANASEQVRELEAFASPGLVAQLAPRFESDVPRQVVRSAAVAGTVALDDQHALITVAATLATPGPARRLITVPVARDASGALLVYDLPSFASAPGRATIAAPAGESLVGNEREAISDVLEPFLRAYLAGDSKGLAYLVPPGTQITAAAGRWELIDLTSLSALGPATDAGRVVLATVQARDERLSTTYTLRYRVRLVRRDRWYVAGLNDGRGSP